ncbi:MAG: metallophosphoesterase family protein [Bacteroidales bacterium]
MPFIGLLSDTHSYYDHKLEAFFKDVDEVWHAGDFGSLEVSTQISTTKPLLAVYGNCDGTKIRELHPSIQLFEREGLKFLMTHIGGTPNHYYSLAQQLIVAHSPNIFICGHSHILRVEFDKRNNLLYINPGAAGVEGIHKVRTALRFKVEGGEIKEMEVGEWPKH